MFGLLSGIGSLISGAASTIGSWIGGAAGALTSAVKALAGNKVVQQAAGSALSAVAKSFSKPTTTTPKPKKDIPIRSEGDDKDDGKDKTLLYVAIAGVAAIALILLLKK